MSLVEVLKIIVLGIVEGFTEWLPISSTGHMIILDELIKLNVSKEFLEVFLVVIQLGAILAVVVLYWGKLWPFYIRELPKKQRAIIAKQPVFARPERQRQKYAAQSHRWRTDATGRPHRPAGAALFHAAGGAA